ncbi:usherin isoform X5 [Paramormyrops kingsleyae]|uniref:usherin isoform X5 n=1 Tax=Paramormyrops kingsleyae TaxID=1676925 RepID=UPI003B979694
MYFENYLLGFKVRLSVVSALDRTVIEKSAGERVVLALTVSREAVQIQYNQQDGLWRSFSTRTLGHVAVGQWTHMALQVHGVSASLFFNGLEDDGTPFDTQTLEGPIADVGTGAVMRIGQSTAGMNQFVGWMQDFRFYPVTLTNREIVEVFSGHLPHLHTHPECRCPPSHPRVHPLVERYCIPNLVEDTTDNRVLRLSRDAHPLHYINDNDIGTSWISSVFTSLDQLDEGISITFDLQTGEYQVFYVILQFLGPQPEAVRIQRRTSGDSAWRDWQYLARDCAIFGMENSGPLAWPDSVNCLQFPRDVPFSRGNVTFSVLTPEPNPRPGYGDFYNTLALREFVMASQVRVHLQGQYHTREPHVPVRHRYYGVHEITISGRCDCHGYADRCDTGRSPYRCLCLPESHTEGDNCERCKPLFNDKPFRRGNQFQAYNCRPCQCHGHADSCHYDSTLDPVPGEHFRAGGGVCNSCQHNTTGRNCELCRNTFYREVNSVLWMENVCKPCDCLQAGTVNGRLACDPIGGQCKCKRHVSGRQCNQCQAGFYELRPSHPDGCRACNCNTAGTMQADITCHQDSGQCHCKANVIGLTCDRCNFGFKFLNSSNPVGCVPCSCNLNGSLHPSCDPSLGQCECRPRVRGLLCDACVPGSFGLSATGTCRPCDCHPAGTVPGNTCDPVTGQCVCKPRAGGRRCDACRDGFHSLDRDDPLGCLPCQCDPRGTFNGSSVCDKAAGQCPCKAGIQGPRCTHCSPHHYNLSTALEFLGCRPCQCDPTGTVLGTVCDAVSGQCVCQPSRHSQDCSTCRPGFSRSPLGASGCRECECHPAGALSPACEAETGQCACRHPSVAGRRCDQCEERYRGFDPVAGRCEECGCDPAGSLNGTCHPESGRCHCKAFVRGDRCDTCAAGASHMDASNQLGCSQSPSQQPPPTGQVLNASAIQLTWSPPDSPNSNMLKYALLRDSHEVATLHAQHPFEPQVFVDTGLSPYTMYSYQLVTSNVRGHTSSARVSYRTLAGIPLPEHLSLHLMGRATPTSATFNWTRPRHAVGPVKGYMLSAVAMGDQEERVHYSGLGTEATASGLSPFTRYNFSLRACTSAGCTQSKPLGLTTPQAAPQLQPAPRVSTNGLTRLSVTWDPPAQPNGVIIRHELFMRGPVESQDHGATPIPERRVFSSSGWLSPQPTPGASNKGALTPPQSSATVMDLEPFSTYQFRVLSANMAGSTLSEWATGKTEEGEPRHMPTPRVIPISPSSLTVSWETPSSRDARGKVMKYAVRLHREQALHRSAPPVISTVLRTVSPEEREYTVEGLRPYSEYNFTVELCNRLGCVASPPVTGRTLPAAPAGLSPPKLKGLNVSVMEVSWEPPRDLNGPPPLYQVERLDPSLSDPHSPVAHGTRFPGHGYFLFPNTTLPLDAYFTGIQLSFRTRAEEGLILCALSPGDQDEYIALQIRNGRPFFLFDPQASATAVSPEDDGGRRYNDGQWHHVIATRTQAVGTITVDGQYRGSSSATSGRTIIGENTGVFIGGLPETFILLREDAGDGRLVRQGFSGCLRDVLIKTSDSPSEVWQPLAWGTALESMQTYQSWEGCPVHTEEGAHFLGQGFLELRPSMFSAGDSFEVSFEFKTDQLNALLLFASDTEGDDYILAELQDGSLQWTLRWGGRETQLHLWAGLSYCDGSWNSVTLLKRGAWVSASMNELSEERPGAAAEGPLRVSSTLYLGGVPEDASSKAPPHLGLLHGFGGCIRAVRLARGAVVDLAAASSRAVRVNLDGCPSADTAVNCRGNDSILAYTGSERRAEDHTVQPFTEYLYRVLALGEGGWTSGSWERGRSLEAVCTPRPPSRSLTSMMEVGWMDGCLLHPLTICAAPQSMLPPSRVVCVNGYSAEVSWDEPTEVRGVIEKYIVKAYNRDDPMAAPVSAAFPHAERRAGTLSGLAPFTSYTVTVTACTRAGCAESASGGWNISTPQEAPEGVMPPKAVVYPTSLWLSWDPPQKANGIITEYLLYKDGSLIYRGDSTEFNITGLEVYSPHWLRLTACTSSGCSNSSTVTQFTAQTPPAHMDPPLLTPLDSRSIHVQWTAPSEANGVLEYYALYVSTPGVEPLVACNSSELFEDHTLYGLVPGTTYTFQIAACTGGGCTLSSPSVQHTDESTPEDVPAPSVVSLSPDSFNVSWPLPSAPNGVITGYRLWMDGLLVQDSLSQHFWVGNLSAWNLHSFRVQACTAEGCALGPPVEMRTLEAAPVGPVALEIHAEGPRLARARWTGPARPNGNLTYAVLFKGIFYQDSAENSSVVEDTRTLHTSTEAGCWSTIVGLLPFSSYTVWVNASNSQGWVVSPPIAITLPPGAPDGVHPPRLAAAGPASLQVAWSAPVRSNAPGPLLYQLQMKAAEDQRIRLLLENETTTFSYTAEGLQPYTEYQFGLVVSHSHGQTASNWAAFVTAQDRPGPVSALTVSGIQSRTATVTWQPPSQTNGVITKYRVYANSQLRAIVPSNSTSCTVFPLEPYRDYTFRVEACGEAGCSPAAPTKSLRTAPAPPEDIPPPRLFSDTPTSVLLSWERPQRPNGELERYVVERRLSGGREVSAVGTVLAERPLSFLDNSGALSPWTSYEYRVVASTSQGGSNSSAWRQVTTRPSRPAGLQAPQTLVLGPDSIQVSWSTPLISNGNIESYEIRLLDRRVPHTNTSSLVCTVADLLPDTNYSVTVLACSEGGGHVGGCTESPASHVTTPPAAPGGLGRLSVTVVSESLLVASWPPPTRPNGPNVRYGLLRRKSLQPLASLPPEDLNRWYNVYTGAKLFHEDKGLSRFTTYQYKLLVHNDVGFTTGEPVTATTLAGVPFVPTNVSVQALNHTAVEVNWTTPSLQDLQGAVELYTLWINSSQLTRSVSFSPGTTSVVVGELQPNTEYHLSLHVSNGAHVIAGPAATCRTADGEPKGVLPPEVVTINSTAVCVLWVSPLSPNGVITEYSVYLDGQVHRTGSSTPGYLELGGLRPFTVHDIQVEVCTVYACMRSNSTKVTTVEDQPADLPAPGIRDVGARSVQLFWMHPRRPNGILLGYEVRRRPLLPCTGLRDGASDKGGRCFYLECSAGEDVCGTSCFLPELEVCCAGKVYRHMPTHQCCEDQYVPAHSAPQSICCGGHLLLPLPGHQCCRGFYVPVLPGEVCCPDTKELRVAVGPGNTCCGGRPFSSTAGQLCCGEELHDGYGSQCCGGRVLGDHMVCCGDGESGTAHTLVPGLACCGEQYLNMSGVVCCGGRAHMAGNGTLAVRCCGSGVVPQGEECCNGVGYDPLEYVCADRTPPGLRGPQTDCRPSALCPLSAADTAYCGTCGLDPAVSVCALVSAAPPAYPLHAPSLPGPLSPPGELCPSVEEVVYSGGADRYSLTDTGLKPFTQYQYRVGTWNSFGWGYSAVTRLTTAEDVPWGVSAPRWSRAGEHSDAILLDWQEPTKPNGLIVSYTVLRDGQERYRGMDLSFMDVGEIHPFREYEYQLRACTTAGCTDSSKVAVVTVQGVPENVPAPTVSALGPRALRLSWTAPSQPNGIIREYRIDQIGAGIVFTAGGGARGHNITGLRPHTGYSFALLACTAAGCGASQPSTGRTLQDAPAGVWARPRHLVLNSSAVELHWSEPQEPNGRVFRYRLLRDGAHIFSGDGGSRSYTDTGLQPSSRYSYELEASTEGGNSLSNIYVIHTPASSPERIPAPYNVTIRGPSSVSVAWTPPEVFSDSLPLEYSVLLNPGSERTPIRAAGHGQALELEGLQPFTDYEVRVQACQEGGCGVGDKAHFRTSEAPPEDLDPPVVTATGPTVIEVHWCPPHKPNGVINSYYVHRRPVSTQEELLVFIWSEGPLQFIDASEILRPFSKYEYRLKAFNSLGSTQSGWSPVRTMEAEPEGMAPPIIRPTGAYSVQLSWTPPRFPNGVITAYRMFYQKHQEDPTLNATSVSALTVPGSELEAHLFGLDPYTSYSMSVVAVNTAGSHSSPWASTHTLEASPGGLANLTVEQREDGRALLLHWAEPSSPNGVIKIYNIYSEGSLEFSGLSRQFLFRRLEPHTLYTLVLEACTEAGCSRTAPQPVTTVEALPSSQPPPVAQWVGSSSVELSWSPPVQPNGKISQYQVMGLRWPAEEDAPGNVLFIENETNGHTFSHNVTGLQPWTTYKFWVRVRNGAGYFDGPHVTVQTKQAPPEGFEAPILTHLEGRPNAVVVSWMPPRETNGVLLSYRIQRDDSSFLFSLDSSVLNFTDEDVMAYTIYSYAVTACTAAGCVTSPATKIRTLEAPPAVVEPPVVTDIATQHFNVSWTRPPIHNGEITHYSLELDSVECYRGKKLYAFASGLQPYTSYLLVLIACTNGGCTSSSPVAVRTGEAPPTGLHVPALRVTGSESVEVAWGEPEHPNGVISAYELRRDGLLIYTGKETRFHDFTLLPSVEYSYTVSAKNSQGSTSSSLATARTNPSAPSGIVPPTLQPSSSTDILVVWEPPIRTNGNIVNYTIYCRDPAESSLESLVFSSDHSAFLSRSVMLSDLNPYYRYEVRLEACTMLGCASSDWVAVQTLEAPPAGQVAPTLQLQKDANGLQTTFLLSWPPPSQPNGKILHFELYRRLVVDSIAAPLATLVYRNASTSYHDTKLRPDTAYEYQVWAVNSAGRAGSPWAGGQSGPAPPEGVLAPSFLQIHATSAVVEITPPTQPNGPVGLYRVLAESEDAQLLVSEGTSLRQTLHGLRPFTLYTVRVEVCTCLQCCSQGPPRELITQPAAPAQQLPPRTLAINSRSTLVEWDEPLSPNGVIESCEVHSRTSCPQPFQPVPSPCSPGTWEISYFGRGWSFNVTGLRPYTSYDVRVVCYNNVGSTASKWTSFTTLKEPPQYLAPFLVTSNLTTMFLDWGSSFALHGLLRDFVLMENGLRIYSGFHSSLHIPRTSDKTSFFQVTCNTDTGSASSPLVTYNTATGVAPMEPTPVGKTGTPDSRLNFHTEIWFIILMVVLCLLLLALLLGLLLQRALSKPPFVRERPPLLPLQKRSSMGVYPPTDTYTPHATPEPTDTFSSVTLKAFSMRVEGLTETRTVCGGSYSSCHGSQITSVLRTPDRSHLSHTCSHSGCQVTNTHDKKSLLEEGLWDPGEQGHESRMFVEDEDLMDAVKGISTVRKEQTTFTDTRL